MLLSHENNSITTRRKATHVSLDSRLSVNHHRSLTVDPNASAFESKAGSAYHMTTTTLNLIDERNPYEDDARPNEVHFITSGTQLRQSYSGFREYVGSCCIHSILRATSQGRGGGKEGKGYTGKNEKEPMRVIRTLGRQRSLPIRINRSNLGRLYLSYSSRYASVRPLNRIY